MESLDGELENVESSVADEHWEDNEVQVDQHALIANTKARVEERLATICAAVPGKRECPHRFVPQDERNLLQRDSDKHSHPLRHHQVVDSSQFCRFFSVLRVLNCQGDLAK